MAEVKLRNQGGDEVGTVTLPDKIFGIEPNVAVMHQVVTAQLAAARAGTHSTKTRAEVRGGGAKPWRQKGTGRARAGSIRSPIWVGGGRSHGPKPRDYSQRTPKKMKKLALRSALSDRVVSDGIFVIDEWKFEKARTKDAVEAIESLGIDDRSILLVASDDEQSLGRSFRNIQGVSVISPSEMNPYDILRTDIILVGVDSLRLFAGDGVEVRAKSKAKSADPAKKSSAKTGKKTADAADAADDDAEDVESDGDSE